MDKIKRARDPDDDADIAIEEFVRKSPSLNTDITKIASIVQYTLNRRIEQQSAEADERTRKKTAKRARDAPETDVKQEVAQRPVSYSFDLVYPIVRQLLIYGVCAVLSEGNNIVFPNLAVKKSAEGSVGVIVTADLVGGESIGYIAWIPPSPTGEWNTPIASMHADYTENVIVRVMRQAVIENLVTMRTPTVIIHRQDELKTMSSALDEPVDETVSNVRESMVNGGDEYARPFDAVPPPVVLIPSGHQATVFQPRHGPSFRYISDRLSRSANPRLSITKHMIRSLMETTLSVIDSINKTKK